MEQQIGTAPLHTGSPSEVGRSFRVRVFALIKPNYSLVRTPIGAAQLGR